MAKPDAPVSEIGRSRIKKGVNTVLKFFHAAKAIGTGLLLSALWLPTAQAGDMQQLYLVRHAEKADLSKDPALSACGEAQATALATLLQDVNLPQLYHSGYQRTQQTAAANLKAGRQLQQYDAKDLPALAAQLRKTTTNALVVGHSNTTPQLATLLSQLAAPALQESDYGRIYQLTRAGEEWSLQILQLPIPAICQR
jgi:broad specificity phosphatase PhoE